MRQLRHFLAVADAGHITRAAAQLGRQQPPLSPQIKALEASLGLVLFKRHPKGVWLTDAGRLLQAEARRLRNDALRLADNLPTGGSAGAFAQRIRRMHAQHAALLREVAIRRE